MWGCTASDNFGEERSPPSVKRDIVIPASRGHCQDGGHPRPRLPGVVSLKHATEDNQYCDFLNFQPRAQHRLHLHRVTKCVTRVSTSSLRSPCCPLPSPSVSLTGPSLPPRDGRINEIMWEAGCSGEERCYVQGRCNYSPVTT